MQNDLNWFLGVILAIFIPMMISVIMEVINHWPLQKRGASKEIHLISSLGIYIVVIQLIAVIWGNETKVLRAGINKTFTVSEEHA